MFYFKQLEIRYIVGASDDRGTRAETVRFPTQTTGLVEVRINYSIDLLIIGISYQLVTSSLLTFLVRCVETGEGTCTCVRVIQPQNAALLAILASC